MGRKISPGRKGAYYFGMGLMLLGGIIIASAIVSSIVNFGDFTDFEQRSKSGMFRAVGGAFLLFIGVVIRIIGAGGLAGSGVVLDPEQAREDLEPYTRMAGGMVKDALKEADIDLGGSSEKVVMIKCRACGKLNEEDSKFCQECGKDI